MKAAPVSGRVPFWSGGIGIPGRNFRFGTPPIDVGFFGKSEERGVVDVAPPGEIAWTDAGPTDAIHSVSLMIATPPDISTVCPRGR